MAAPKMNCRLHLADVHLNSPASFNFLIITQMYDLWPSFFIQLTISEKKLENFGGHLLSEDDNSFWAPPYWNITKETFSLGRTEL